MRGFLGMLGQLGEFRESPAGGARGGSKMEAPAGRAARGGRWEGLGRHRGGCAGPPLTGSGWRERGGGRGRLWQFLEPFPLPSGACRGRRRLALPRAAGRSRLGEPSGYSSLRYSRS